MSGLEGRVRSLRYFILSRLGEDDKATFTRRSDNQSFTVEKLSTGEDNLWFLYRGNSLIVDGATLTAVAQCLQAISI